ncbi:MAG: tetratricopeptide repeat protein, partial [Polyangiaceae bacterium]
LPLVPWVALVSAPLLHPKHPLRVLRALLAFVGAAAALVVYTYFRRRFFPITSAVDSGSALSANQSPLARGLSAFLHWFQQPQLPHDPVNNPLVDADLPHRVAGALRVYARGIGQLLFPWTLSGDYSAPQEPIPDRLFFPESIIGGLLLAVPPLVGVALWIASLFRGSPAAPDSASDRRRSPHSGLVLLAIGLVWLPVAYFPHSNIPVLLPTIRAERFWYLPAFGSACLLAVLFTRLLRDSKRWGIVVVSVFLGFQALAARWHALDYTDDLIFWRATHYAVPRSAKAQLNYSVMLGARGQLEERLKINAEAMRLAPKWPMAHVYYGDTLCRLKRAEQAWPHYLRGFELAPNDLNLIALGLQCAWEEKIIDAHKDEILALSEAHPGSWLAYLGSDLVYNGVANGGVQKKYRPRAYDEGPKSDASQ